MSDLHARLVAEHPHVTVWAAGGLVLRDGDHALEVLLIRRPHRDDWSFPKGKLDPGETLGQAAEREVHEETGFRCRRLDRLPEIRYVDARGRDKLVVYWTMEIVGGLFEPNDEVDALGWFDRTSAAAVLTYEHDERLLDAIPKTQRDHRMPA